MGYRIGRSFTFCAAHHLADLPAGHKCARPHGHTYTVDVTLTSAELVAPGFVTDFASLTPLDAYIEAEFDHRDLNEVLDTPPTCENLARHLADWITARPAVLGGCQLSGVRVWESPRSWAEYVPEDSR